VTILCRIKVDSDSKKSLIHGQRDVYLNIEGQSSDPGCLMKRRRSTCACAHESRVSAVSPNEEITGPCCQGQLISRRREKAKHMLQSSAWAKESANRNPQGQPAQCGAMSTALAQESRVNNACSQGYVQCSVGSTANERYHTTSLR
jgi:hypothetical protein